jgi:SpoVK/Ycf46/Vps4 family AAA+-type ATPase
VIHLDLSLPTPEELEAVVASVARSLRERTGAQVSISKPALRELVQALSGLTRNQARQAVAHAILTDGKLDDSDVRNVQAEKARQLARDGLLEYLPPEDNPYELGGFRRLAQWLERAKVGFSQRARELGLDPPKGILLVGVQGCGKSLAAKAIAREWRQPLLKLDAGRLHDKFHGESERKLRAALRTAEALSPAVLWIDEIEKAFSSSSSGDFDGGTSQRIFATLLTWLQEKQHPIFVVATANDVFRLPPELMRKGRFDEIFFVDLPDADERVEIFDIHLRKRKQEPLFFDMQQLVGASEGFSGAEIEQAVISSMYGALHDEVELSTEHVLAELRATQPLSVSRKEDIERLRAVARQRFVPVR